MSKASEHFKRARDQYAGITTTEEPQEIVEDDGFEDMDEVEE